MTTAKKPKKSTEITANSQTGPRRAALEETIEALRSAGRLADVDSARIDIARGLASAVDAQPDNPTLWREYRAAEKDLRQESTPNADPFDALLQSISAEMGNEKKQKTQNTRG